MSNILTVELPFDVDPAEARLLLSMKLFEEGRVSLGRAADMAGYTKRTFAELLGKRGIPVFDYPPDELDDDLETLGRLREEIERERTGRASEGGA